MKLIRTTTLVMLFTICLLLLTACMKDTVESETESTNALETMEPGVYVENGNNDKYIGSISGLRVWGPNPTDIDYPTMDHIAYIYLFDQKGHGNPDHSLLIDIANRKAYYTTSSNVLTGAFGTSACTEIDLDLMDVDKIIGFQSLNNILDWEHLYSADGGDTSWLVTLYFDDGSFFQSTGEYYPEVYEEFEEDIWPFISEKTGEELWWMRGRP